MGGYNVSFLDDRSKKEKKPSVGYTVQNLILLKKAIGKLKGEGDYEVNSPVVNWEEKESAIEIHCDAGQILTRTGSRAQIAICGFF